MIAWFWRLLFSALVLFVGFMSLTPNPDSVGGGYAFMEAISRLLFGSEEYHDKIGHFIAYATLAGVYAQTAWRPFGRQIYGVLWLAAFGLAMELAQGMTTYRELSGTDLLANWAGLAIGYPAGRALSVVLRSLGVAPGLAPSIASSAAPATKASARAVADHG